MNEHPENVSWLISRMILVRLDIIANALLIYGAEHIECPELLAIEHHGHDGALHRDQLTQSVKVISHGLSICVQPHKDCHVGQNPLKEDRVGQESQESFHLILEAEGNQVDEGKHGEGLHKY